MAVNPVRLPDDADEAMLSLSNREREVLIRLARGQEFSEIAAETGLYVSTISTYKGRIFKKLALKNEVDMAHYAIARGLVALKHLRPPTFEPAWCPGCSPDDCTGCVVHTEGGENG